MEKDSFIKLVWEQLQSMLPAQKDAWILSKAKLLPESKQEDFMMTLTGQKLIEYMPTEAEIAQFCQKVQDGQIYVEYDTCYCEFDENGRYMDDWKAWHNDLYDAFPFLDRAFRGCHDLVQLEKYELAGRILDQICRLEFRVLKAERVEEFRDGSSYIITDAVKEQMLSMNAREIGHDWIMCILQRTVVHEKIPFAQQLLEIFQSELCKDVCPSEFLEYISEEILDDIKELLEDNEIKLCNELEKYSDRRINWYKIKEIEKRLAKVQHLLLDINNRCKRQPEELKRLGGESLLEASWRKISEIIEILHHGDYVEKQLEVAEIQRICKNILKKETPDTVDWKIRKGILAEITGNNFFKKYGCYETLKELAEQLYVTKEETLAYADLLSETWEYKKEAGDLYRRYGVTEQYIRYLEHSLNQESEYFVELIQCYCKNGNIEKARQTAELGLSQCSDDLTELFIFLLQNAKNNGDKENYKKLYASAKRRKKVDMVRIEHALANFHGEN